MSNDDAYQQTEVHIPEKKGMSGCAIAGIGCGVAFLVLLIAVVIGAIWIKNNARQFGTDMAVTAMKQGLSELDVPDDQRDRIHGRIDEVGQRFKDGELEMDQVALIFQKISDGPLMSAGMSLFFKRAYLKESGLSEEELEAADTSIQRFARGVIDETIPKDKSEAVIDMISVKDAQGQRTFKEELSDDELREFLKAATTAADDAGVAADVPEINFADEFDKSIDDALGQFDASGDTDAN